MVKLIERSCVGRELVGASLGRDGRDKPRKIVTINC